MFEFSVALRYLLPKRRALSTSLIALLSILVISLVVWLLLVFLSVTAGIEKRWLGTMTTLHAPIRISPTAEYYDSYYYNIDRIAFNSDFQTKTIGEKQNATLTDPYDNELDREIPPFWKNPDKKKNGAVKDLVKEASSSLKNIEGLTFEDYEISAALIKLKLDDDFMMSGKELSQVSYLLSFTENNPRFSELLVSPSMEDLNSLLKNLDSDNFNAYFSNANIQAMSVNAQTEFTLFQLKIEKPLKVFASNENIIISDKKTISGYESCELTENKGKFYLGKKLIDSSTPFSLDFSNEISGTVKPFDYVLSISFDEGFSIQTAFFPFTITKASPKVHFQKSPAISPLWAYSVDQKVFFSKGKKTPILLPKSYQKMGACIGASGDFHYETTTATSSQMHNLPFSVAGFYDPGVMQVGTRLIIVPIDVIRSIDSCPIALDNTPINGLFVWFDDLYKAKLYKQKIKDEFEKQGIAKYWKVEAFTEYGFAKDLMQQFQSDRTLFTLIGVIVLIVACCNIISLLIVLVNDKKKEIAILQALGATPKSIAFIFGICGMILGTLGAFIGSFFALITLKNLDTLTTFLSSMQGHELFNAAFFGEKLPASLSIEALLFVSIATPIIALLAGLVPAIKAARIKPAKVLRSV